MKFKKNTKAVGSRRYDDACGTAHALEVVGDRWALLVIRELMLGPRRFSQLRADLPGLSASILTQRLSDLERRKVLVKTKLPPPAATPVYELTEWGYEAEPITSAMGRWAARSPSHDPSRRISGVSLLLSFRTMLDVGRCRDLDACIGFRFGDDVYGARLTSNGLLVAQGDPPDPRVRFMGAPAALGAAVYGQVPLARLEAEGVLRISGDRRLAQRFVTLFPLPERFAP
jgi:DNA-binding HxlR family transcriptional regulator